MRTARLLLTAAAVLLPATTATPSGAGDAHRVEYRPPVVAPVIDPFRPPTTPYGPGNRGVELATTPGTPVGAAAPGTVTFAGPVAGARYVTLQHADRVRTTYGPLAGIEVVAGQAVAGGDRLGTSGPSLLWTARLGEAYLDPAVLLAASGVESVRLVPNAPPGGRPPGEPAAGPRPVPPEAAEWGLGAP